MKLRTALVASMMAFVLGTTAAVAQTTGEIFGRAVDTSGAVLPGTTVTIASPALIQPRVTATSEAGSYNVPELPIGTYSVTFELPGFRTLVHQDIRITVGFRAQVNAAMQLSTVQETVTVTGESPLVDVRETGTKTSFDLEQMQNIPSARDPWVMLERTPGITMDRANVGGSQSGQQSAYISRGAAGTNNKWSIDGVDITDMSATGASPIYYDFDMLEEMQVTTGGADVTQQTGGVGINLVMKSGTDKFKGSARYYITDEKFQADNVTDAIRADGAGSGAPIQNIVDRGFEVGGPIKTGKAWFWGSYGAQKIKVGVVGFWKNTAGCGPVRPTETKAVRECLETDLTELNNYNWKIQYVPFTNNKLTFQNTWAEKVRNARDASVTRPIETTFRQKAVSSDFGKFGWITGPSPFWSARDQHVISDRWLMEVMYAHLGNNFVLDFHEDSLRDVQARFETSTGTWGRSFQAATFMRPTNSVDVTSSYFLPQTFGGDNALKFGYRWRSAHSTSIGHHGGFVDARFTNGIPNSADMWRDQYAESHLDTHAFYVQDTFTRNRLTVNLGFRVDRQDDTAVAATVPANPLIPAQLPAINFPGADAGVTWTDVSPRVGLTYDFSGNGRTVASASYAAYYGQLAPGQLSSVLAGTGAVQVRYPWTDRNGDTFVTANELDLNTILARSATYDPANPGNFRTPGTVDPNVKNDQTREFIVGFDRQIGQVMAVGASYIWRKYDRFFWNDRLNWTSANYRSVSITPTGCPADARCEPITYFEPSSPLPAPFQYTNIPDRWRDFNGFEVTFQKRHSNRWSADASYAYNNAVDVWDTGNAYEDPTCTVGLCPGEQIYAPEAGGSGIDNVFINAKWLMKLSGAYNLPYGVNLAGQASARQGYPFPAAIRTPNRANSGGQADVNLDPLGENRHPTFTQLNLRVDKNFTFGRVQLKPTFDVFNVMNSNTVLARRRLQASAVANDISGIVAPRVARFAVQVRW
ncbi:MAG: TonB-dependent receptor [Acidobacteriota bacterium]|nr:TonB-dependent receptor [Acidobacteriota bacterium]